MAEISTELKLKTNSVCEEILYEANRAVEKILADEYEEAMIRRGYYNANRMWNHFSRKLDVWMMQHWTAIGEEKKQLAHEEVYGQAYTINDEYGRSRAHVVKDYFIEEFRESIPKKLGYPDGYFKIFVSTWEERAKLAAENEE